MFGFHFKDGFGNEEFKPFFGVKELEMDGKGLKVCGMILHYLKR